MIENKRNIIPVLLGADLNAYSVALAFKYAYGINSHAFARYKCGATENSKFIKTHVNRDFDKVLTAVPELLRFASENSGADLFLIPCADWYVELLMKSKEAFSGIYHMCLPRSEHYTLLTDKESFYKEMRKAKIPMPKTFVFSKSSALFERAASEIAFPAVIKPTSSTEYWKHPFLNMRKVYFPNSQDEAIKIADRIFESGYSESLVLQQKLDDGGKNRVMTTFSDKSGKVVRAVYGEVVLEECGKTSTGNHSAIVTAKPTKICHELIRYLNHIKYVGFANFDIMFNRGEECVLELNARQGRSCDYMRAAGVNIAKLIVEGGGEEKNKEDVFSYEEIYWHYPPNRTVLKNTSDDERARIEKLISDKKDFTPYNNDFEGVKRTLYKLIHNIRLSRRINSDFKEKK